MSREAENAAFVGKVQRWLDVDADGWAGPGTNRAWDAATSEKKSSWPAPDERSLIQFYGSPGPSGLITVPIPYPMRLAWDHGSVVRRITCNRKVAESLVICLEGIMELYGDLSAVQDARMDLYSGCYNLRRQRGGRSWSLHAWGAAIDLDSLRNGNHTPWPSIATMPVEVVDIFEEHGWKSGARAWGRDAMHFQATR